MIANSSKLEDGSNRPTITMYYCFYCDTGSLDLEEVRTHWENFHKSNNESSMFKYRENVEEQYKCAYCGESGTKSMLVNHIWKEHGQDRPVLLIKSNEGWICDK